MEFRIQYFGSLDRLLYTDVLEADELIEVLEWARDVLRQPSDNADADPAELPIGYVILNDHGQQVARGHRR